MPDPNGLVEALRTSADSIKEVAVSGELAFARDCIVGYIGELCILIENTYGQD